MTDAFVIETPKITAGIAVAERSGFRFYTSHPNMRPLEGRHFSSLKAVQRAVETLALTPWLSPEGPCPQYEARHVREM
jgi:hypothetical protein